MGKNKTEPDGETVRRKEGRMDGWGQVLITQ